MRFNKIVLFPFLLTIWVAITNGALINEPNPRLGFPSRSKSVANALYSAIEWPLATFPHEQIEHEVKTMKTEMIRQSRKQYEKLHPDIEMRYVIAKTPRKK